MKPQGTMREYLEVAVQGRRPSRAMPCLNEEQVVAFYSGRLQESEMDVIRDHLAECYHCLALARDARQFLEAMSVSAQPAHGPTEALPSTLSWYGMHRRELLLAAAMVIIAVSIGLLWRASRRETPSEQQAQTSSQPSSATPKENPWRDLKIAKAEYTPAVAPPGDLIWRDDNPGTPSQPKLSPFARAMRPYEGNDFAEVERRLAQFLENNPKHAQGYFYRGVSLLLLGKTADAIAPLEAAIEHGRGRVAEEAHWYLALARLRLGEPSKALEQLEAVMKTSGKHRSEAEQLRQQIIRGS